MWIAIFAILLAFAIAGIVYLTCGFQRFSPVKRLAEKSKLAAWGVSLLCVGAVGVPFLLINVWTVIVVLIHLFIFWLACDIVGWLITRANGVKPYRYYSGGAALIVTALYLGMGWFLAHHVTRTDYTVYSQKNVEPMRIVEIADLHLGITLDGDEFAQQIQCMNACSPDLAVITGDFVDDDSKKADMVKACAALGQLQAKNGVYFIFGNHDKGYGDYRDFSSFELRQELEKNGVVILEDETVDVNDWCQIIGRQDRSEEERGGGRAAMEELTAELDMEKYTIVLDHQPNAYDEEAEAGADLVLSGHTHGGHLWPAGQIGMLIGANDRIYGYERRLGTDFIVSSGISGWALPFKTGTKSEFVIIDIRKG